MLPTADPITIVDAGISSMTVELPTGRLGVSVSETNGRLWFRRSTRAVCQIPHLCEDWILTRVCGHSVNELREPRIVTLASILNKHSDGSRIVHLLHI
jgi:hypothetical protein